MNLEVLLITGLILVGIIAFELYRKAKVKSGRKSGNKVMLSRLSEEAAVLASSVEIFSELSEEYFNSINANGFVELCKINDALKTTIEICTKMSDANDIARRDELLSYVLIKRGKGSSPGFLFQMMDEDLIENLNNWDERLAEILVKLTNGIKTSSSSFKEIGRNRTSKRHNTTQLLNELVGLVRQ